MAINAVKCKYRCKYGWFLFGKYRCEMALPGRKWIATKAVCNACDGPMLEAVHDCTYFKIGTDKPYTDQNTVIVKGYCFKVYKEEKDFRNEIKDLSTCGPKDIDYRKRPISEPAKPVVQEAKASAKPVTAPSLIHTGLKIWTLLPALPVAGLGIYGLVEEIRHWSDWSEIGIWIALTILAISVGIGFLSGLLFRGKRWAFTVYKLLIVLVAFGGLLPIFIIREELLPQFFLEVLSLIFILVGTIISLLVIFGKLPKIKTLLYPEKAKPRRVFSWAKDHLLKGDIIVILLIIFIIIGSILSSKNNKSDISPPPVPAPAPEALAPAPEPAPESAPAPEPPEYTPAPAPEPAPAPIPRISTERPQRLTVPDTQETIRLTLEEGRGFHNDGNYKRAIEMFEKVLALDPDNEEATEGIKKAESAKEAEEQVLGR